MQRLMDGLIGGTKRVFETPMLAAAIYGAAVIGVVVQMALDDGQDHD